MASPLLRLHLAPCFPLCLPWCTWGKFRYPPSLCGGEIEGPRGHGDREMPGLGETAEYSNIFLMCLATPCGWGGKGAVPKCAAKPDAGKAVMCQLRLWWRKKCWLLWLLKILTLWCLDGRGLVNCATGWVTGSMWCSTLRSYKLAFRIWKNLCANHILKYAVVLSVSAAFLGCKSVLVALLCCDGECQNFWWHVACLSGQSLSPALVQGLIFA